MSAKPDRETQFIEYVSAEELRKGILNGSYLIGQHHIPHNWVHDRSYVRNHSLFPNEMDICIPSRIERNRSFDGDIVAVQIIGWVDRPFSGDAEAAYIFSCSAESCFSDIPSESLDKGHLQKPCHNLLHQICSDYDMDADLQWDENKQPIARIVSVILAEEFNIIGRANLTQSGSSVKISPYNSKIPHCKVYRREIPAKIRKELDNHLLLLRINPGEWNPAHRFPQAHFVKSLGYTGTVEGETSAILSTYDIDESSFAQDVIESITSEIEVPSTEKNSIGRQDLSESEFVCSIDPSTARDLDDALSIRQLRNGNFRVGVHIADVSSYVPELSAVDLEAKRRGTSVYLCQKVIPMLPPELSENKCSLNTSSDKLAFSVMWELNRDGYILPNTQWIGKTIIRNQCQLSYEDAQLILVNCPNVDDRLSRFDESTRSKVKFSVTTLWDLAKQIRSRRFRDGSISLEQPKLSFITTSNDSSLAPIDYFIQKQLQANHLVEEFMLLANKCVAEKIFSHIPRAALLRSHKKPNAQLLKFYKGVLKERNIDISISSEAEFSRSIRKISSENAMSEYISMLLIRSFSRAEYVTGSTEEKQKLHHYALNMSLYTHFTSPIRRYADLHVHRLLSKVLDLEKVNGDKEIALESSILNELEAATPPELCIHLNEKHEKARKASDNSQDLFLCLYLDNLRKMAIEKPSANEAYRSLLARLIKVRRSSILVYVRDIASCLEIGFRSNRQLWNKMKVFQEGLSVHVQWKDISSLPLEPSDEVSLLAKAFQKTCLNEEDQPQAKNEDISEECPKLALLEQFTVSLVVSHRLPLQFDAVIHPPEYNEKPLPTPLLNYLRSK